MILWFGSFIPRKPMPEPLFPRDLLPMANIVLDARRLGIIGEAECKALLDLAQTDAEAFKAGINKLLAEVG